MDKNTSATKSVGIPFPSVYRVNGETVPGMGVRFTKEDGLRDSLRELLASAAEVQADPPNNWTAGILESIARSVRDIEVELDKLG